MAPTTDIATHWPEAAREWPAVDCDRLATLDPARLPAHVAIIMDGNGRWARQRGFLDRIRGHEAGIDSVRESVRTCAQLGIHALTLYAFSKENWNRPGAEITALMKLLARFLHEELPTLTENNIRLKTIGVIEDLPEAPRNALDDVMEQTAGNTGMTLNLALSYGGRDEILRAVRRLATESASGELDPDAIDEATFNGALDTAGLPEPDLLVRTSGEMRISNFLLWQIAYTELHVTPVLWPDFRREHLLQALIDYQKRDRRFGRVNGSPASGGSA